MKKSVALFKTALLAMGLMILLGGISGAIWFALVRGWHEFAILIGDNLQPGIIDVVIVSVIGILLFVVLDKIMDLGTGNFYLSILPYITLCGTWGFMFFSYLIIGELFINGSITLSIIGEALGISSFAFFGSLAAFLLGAGLIWIFRHLWKKMTGGNN